MIVNKMLNFDDFRHNIIVEVSKVIVSDLYQFTI